MEIERKVTEKTLDNGVKIITYQNDSVYSATIGVWFRVGAVDETEKNAGISHFIEHMMFKGTKNRTAKEIAFEMDSVGGQLNAFTSKECTCYNATVTYEHLPKAVKLLADMVKHSLIAEEELNKERGVILEEINMVEDSPEDVIHRLHSETFFEGNPLAKSVIGSKETVGNLTSEELKQYIQKNYTSDRMVISVAGRFDTEELHRLIADEFADFPREKGAGLTYEGSALLKTPGRMAFRNMSIEQTHLCLGLPGLPIDDDQLYNLYIFNNLFGGNMSSRLFQRVREERGLCYTVYSYVSTYMNTGAFTVYSATNRDQVQDVVSLVRQELLDILENGPKEDEIHMAKEQMKGSFTLGIEGTGGRMSQMGRSLLLAGKAKSPDEILSSIDRVNYDTMMAVVKEVLHPEQMTAAFVGNVDQAMCESFIKE